MAAARIYMSRVNGGAATPDSTFFSQTFGVCPSLNQKWWVWMFLIVICGDITSTVSILHCTYLVGIPQKFSNIQSRPHCHGESTKGNGSKHLKITKQIPYFLCMVNGSSNHCYFSGNHAFWPDRRRICLRRQLSGLSPRRLGRSRFWMVRRTRKLGSCQIWVTSWYCRIILEPFF